VEAGCHGRQQRTPGQAEKTPWADSSFNPLCGKSLPRTVSFDSYSIPPPPSPVRSASFISEGLTIDFRRLQVDSLY
jgi:hypothetical protein